MKRWDVPRPDGSFESALLQRGERFPASSIAIVGAGPLDLDHWRGLLPGCRLFSQYPLPSERIDFVIIGRRDYDLVLMVDAFRRGFRETKVLPQEGLLDLIRNEVDWWSDKVLLRVAVRDHAGLRAAKHILLAIQAPFLWPAIGKHDVVIGAAWNSGMEEVSALSRNGYSSDGPVAERREAIRRTASDRSPGYVADVLRLNINTKAGRADPLLVSNWEGDLDWLLTEFFVPRIWRKRTK